MSQDPFAHDDAAYVLGALSPAQRRAFEDHLADCSECSRSVKELAGMPGLLGELEESAFTGTRPDQPPVPETLLPQLLRRARRLRRQALLATLGGVAAAIVLTAVITGLVVGRAAGPDPGPAAGPALAMTPVDQDRLAATVSLDEVAWGTKMRMTCDYSGEAWDGAAPSYALVVHLRDGSTQQVATWRAVLDRTTRIDAATDADPDQIDSIDVVLTGTSRRVLTLSGEDV